MSSLSLRRLINDLAAALKAVDASHPREQAKAFKPGIGPLSETTLLYLVMEHLKASNPSEYGGATPRAYPRGRAECDMVIPGAWAVELKLARPFGDNGRPAERWSENLLYPYPGNTSVLGDCLKLLSSGFSERKAVIVVGYEHNPPKIPLEPAIRGFELLAGEVLSIRLSERETDRIGELVHPYHQQATIAGWEVLGTSSPSAA